MLGMPAPTGFDLNFRLLGIPVRINPFFWVLAAVLGWEWHDGWALILWMVCVFLSILVHEFGHALTARTVSRQRPVVVLFAMGGLCFTDREDRSPWRRLAMILMGPGAGFLLFGLVAAFEAILIGSINFGPINQRFHDAPRWSNELILRGFGDLLVINLFWSVFNLLPIFPLDGGQVAQTFLVMQNRREGAKRGFIVSMVTAGLVALLLYQQGMNINALFVAYLGLINYQFYQAAQYQGRYGEDPEDDADWWRR